MQYFASQLSVNRSKINEIEVVKVLGEMPHLLD
jgi:hypothetical protein